VTRAVADEIRDRRAAGELYADIGRTLGMGPLAVIDVTIGRAQVIDDAAP
jgi:hypothetical protein